MSRTLLLCWFSFATLLSTVVPVTDSCSSQVPNRPIETTTPASETTTIPQTTYIMTEPIEESTIDEKETMFVFTLCEGQLALDFCLNKGTCWTHKSLVLWCECPDHFTGDRCEYKQFAGSYGGGMPIPQTNQRRRRWISNSAMPPKPGKRGHHRNRRAHRFQPTIAP